MFVCPACNKELEPIEWEELGFTSFTCPDINNDDGCQMGFYLEPGQMSWHVGKYKIVVTPEESRITLLMKQKRKLVEVTYFTTSRQLSFNVTEKQLEFFKRFTI